MFTKKITDSDAFIEMSSAAQALYFHLNQGADDDGFNNQVQMAMWKAHASTDDLKILMAKNYIIRFENGVIVIKHWRMHNTLRKDRYTPTNFQDELNQLGVKDNGAYTLGCQVVAEGLPSGCQVVAEGLPQVSVGKDSKGKVSLGEGSVATDTAAATEELKKIEGSLGQGVVFLSDKQVADLIDKLGIEGFDRYVKRLADYIIKKNAHINSHYSTILKWAKEDSAMQASKETKPVQRGTFDTKEFEEAAIRHTLKGVEI